MPITVQRGDSLWSIAQQAGVGLDELEAANPQIENPDLIYPGQVVNLPSDDFQAAPAPDFSGLSGGTPPPAADGGSYTVQSGDSLSAIAETAGVSLAALVVANPQITDANLIFAGQVLNLPSGASAPDQAAPPVESTAGGAAGRFTKPAVIDAPSPNYNSRYGTPIDAIVLHHTGSNSGSGAVSWLRNPASEVSANYVLDRDGTIYQLVGDEKRAWHAGEGALNGVPTDVNARSIGIEIVNDGSGTTPFTEAQYGALTQLVGYLKQEYGVPMGNIVGHKDVALPYGRKNDPAPNFDWNRLRNAIT